MKLKIAGICVVVAAAFFALGNAAGRRSLSKQTKENLSTAMHGEAFAYAKYMLYGQHARKGGNAEVAKLFENAARMERFQHFAEEADLLGLVRTDSDNLTDAIQGESYEVETMYRQFAEQARAAGDQAAADRFEEIRHDEMKHRDAFKAALAQVQHGRASVAGE